MPCTHIYMHMQMHDARMCVCVLGHACLHAHEAHLMMGIQGIAAAGTCLAFGARRTHRTMRACVHGPFSAAYAAPTHPPLAHPPPLRPPTNCVIFRRGPPADISKEACLHSSVGQSARLVSVRSRVRTSVEATYFVFCCQESSNIKVEGNIFAAGLERSRFDS